MTCRFLFTLALSLIINIHALAQDNTKPIPSDESAIIRSLVNTWGGGNEINGNWTLNRHWVGMLEVVVAKGGYEKGKHLESKVKSTPARFNALTQTSRFGARKHSTLTSMSKRGSFSQFAKFREKIPSIEDLRDDKKRSAILADFGEQHGFTDFWGDLDGREHWSESWRWFSVEKPDQLRVLSAFAHVSQLKEEPKQIDHLLICEGYFRLTDPSNADDLKNFPLPDTVEAERQKKINDQDERYPEPLRSFLKAKHSKEDSDLEEYFAYIGAFREQPNGELLKQLVANLDEETREIDSMTSDLYRSLFFDGIIGQWKPEKHREACRLLLDALPSASSRKSLMDALKIGLAETGIEKLDFRADGIAISMSSQSRGTGSSFSYSRFDIQEAEMQRMGEIIRDELLRVMK